MSSKEGPVGLSITDSLFTSGIISVGNSAGGIPSNLPVDMSSKEGPVGVVVTVSFGVSVLGGIPSNFPVSISSKEGLFPIGI